MKAFRIFFKDGQNVVVKAESFNVVKDRWNTHSVVFMKSETEEDTNFYLPVSEVLFIAPNDAVTSIQKL